MKKLWRLLAREEIHRMGLAYLITLAVVMYGILAAQYGWSTDERVFYYSHGGAEYDFWCIVLVPAVFAFAVGAVELAMFLSSPGGSTTEGE